MAPPPDVLNVPAVKEIPWQAPVVPRAIAVIASVLLAPEVLKLAVDAKPTPAAPLPRIVSVAMILPAVVKAALTLIPLPPVVPPKQEEKVKSPDVSDVQAPLIATP
jgi:hypothetical protein